MAVHRFAVYDVRNVFFLVVISATSCSPINTDENTGEVFLEKFDAASALARERNEKAKWNYYINTTKENEDIKIQEGVKYANFELEWARKALKFPWKEFQNANTKRQFSKITNIGTAAMEDMKKQKRLKQVIAKMETIHSTAEVCMPSKQCLPLEPDLLEIMGKSRDYDKLLYVWEKWRDETGRKMKSDYIEMVALSNEAVKISGYKDTGDYWKSMYESATFEEDIHNLFLQIEPFYQQLHAYTKNKLKQIYGADKFPSSGHIPAHILGNMWGQEWDNLLDILEPFKNKASVDVTEELVKQNYTAMKMYQLSDDFFGSLGMIKMPQEFWNGSVLEKPKDGRPFTCQAESFDFFNGKDFRIRHCTEISHSHLLTVHHEMGHIEYFMQYKHQPVIFRDGANPGFHEGIADVVSLSLQTPKHLRKIGLLKSETDDEESEINFLMSMALVNIAFLPFGYLVDQWRWSVFRGDTPPKDYNKKWWELRCRYEGISPPVIRTDDDFDPGAKFHVPANVPYIRYFVSNIIQFQILQKLCEASGHVGPLHRCDFYNSTAAGDLFSKMQRLGSSKPWPEVMRVITGQDKMDAKPITNYFQPLMDWLTEQNRGSDITWDDACPPIDTSGVTCIRGSNVAVLLTILLLFCL